MDKARKIIIFSLTRSGCIAYTNELLKSFSKYKPIVYVNEQSKADYSQDYKTIITYKGYFSFLINSIAFFFKSYQLLKKIKLETKRPLIYITAFHPWNYFLALNAKRLNIPCIITIHDFYTHVGEKSYLVEFLQKKIIKYATQVVFLSQSESDKALKNKSIQSSKIIILPHPLFQGVSNNSLTYNSKPNILFLGRIKKYKGIELLIDAVQSLEINSLTIAGEGRFNASQSKKINVINKRLSNEEMMSLIDKHEILVLPYTEASQSGILSLGLSKQVVMVITNLPGLREQISEDSAVWCQSNASSIRDSIVSVIENQALFDTVKNNLVEEKRLRQIKWESDFNKLIETIAQI